jgi:hypothetical protein
MPLKTPLFRLMARLTIPVTAIAFVLIVDLVLHPFEPNFYGQPFWHRWLYGFVLASLNIVIGVLCNRRAPGNIIGPLLIIYGAGLSTSSLRASFDPLLAALILFVGGFFGWIGFFVLVLLFPNGKPHPRWMRWFLLVMFISVASYVPVYALGSPNFIVGPDDAPSSLIENPLFIPMVGPINQVLYVIMVQGLTPIILIALPVSVFSRYRASSPQEKAQIRWILWGALVMPLSFIAQRIIEALGMPALGNTIGAISTILVFTLPAFAIGNAILRHRLYDIDIIIRRTLIYSALTTILAVIYFGGIILTQQLFRAATGETPDIAIVLSTLLIARLFSPIRRRVQDVIDRRLYRRKYDVEKTLAQFQHNLRDEVDIETLKANLISVVNDTMQPNKIALWVREE